MNVRETVINEFRSVFERYGIQTTPEFLRIAESPFNLSAVQHAVDRDLENIREQARYLPSSEIERRVREKDRVHEKQLRQLSRQYALRLLESTRRGLLLSESRAITEQANLKAMAGRSCDVYPCSI
jgi:hypothetical protein